MKNRFVLYGLLLVFLCSQFACQEGKKVHTSENEEKPLKETIASSQDTTKTEKQKNQQIPKKIESFGVDNARRFPSKLRFMNGKVIDITAIDPYRSLPYQRLREDPDGFEHLYDLSDNTRSQQDEILANARINTEAYRESNYLRLLTQSPVIAISNGKAAVGYHAFFYSNEEDILATQGVVIIFDEEGKEITRIQDKQDGFYDIKLSSDGKYLMQKYGTNYGEDGGGQLETGFKFYDMDTGEMVYERTFGRDQFLDAFSFIPELLDWVIIERSPNSNLELYLMHIEAKETYFLNGDLEKHIRDPLYIEELLREFKRKEEVQFLLSQGFKKIK